MPRAAVHGGWSPGAAIRGAASSGWAMSSGRPSRTLGARLGHLHLARDVLGSTLSPAFLVSWMRRLRFTAEPLLA